MRHQLAGYSPLSLRGLVAAAVEAGDRAETLDRLRQDLADRFAADDVHLYASGTDALFGALSAFGGLSPATVALPAYSCFDLASAAVGARARVRFYDIDPGTLSPDLDSLRAALGQGVDVVLAGNLYGYPVEWNAIRQLTDEFGVPVIEDTAQGIGSAVQGRPGGTFGDATILSFGRGKGWTGGGGGALLLRGNVVERAESFGPPTTTTEPASSHRLAAASLQWLFGRPWLYGIPASIPSLGLGTTQYHPPSAPRPMSTFSAAAITRFAEPARTEVVARQRQAGQWLTHLESAHFAADLDPCQVLDGSTSAFLRLPFRARTRDLASEIVARARRFGVTHGYPTPLPHLPALASLVQAPLAPEAFPGASQLAACLVALPTHSLLTSTDVTRTVLEIEAAIVTSR